jgi:hypothetical protein
MEPIAELPWKQFEQAILKHYEPESPEYKKCKDFFLAAKARSKDTGSESRDIKDKSRDFLPGGYECYITQLIIGHWSGYVGLPLGHPLYGKTYNQVSDILAHGGLTYSEPRSTLYPFKDYFSDGTPKHIWWLGFDSANSENFIPADEALVTHKTIRLAHELRTFERRYRTATTVGLFLMSVLLLKLLYKLLSPLIYRT